MTEISADQTQVGLTRADKFNILFEEFRALYGLAEFRLGSLERRAILAWAALGVFLSAFEAMNTDAQRTFLLAVPMAVLWLVRTTINHARSFEDAIRRVGEIECEINRIAGHDLLAFQSRHPSRGTTVGGRTGRESVLAVLITAAAMILTSGYLFAQHSGSDRFTAYLFFAYLAMIAVGCAHAVCTLRAYRYRKPEEGPPRS